MPPRRTRKRLDRLIERRVRTASPDALERYARLLAPTQALRRWPGWYFGLPYERDELRMFARRLIWQRYHDEQIDRPVDIRWCGRLRVRLRLGNDVGWCVFVIGAYEPNELALLAATLRPGMTVVDVGANEGLYTLLAAHRVGLGGHVLAVEPSSREFECLQANIALNRLGNVELLRVALYDRQGTGRLAVAGFGHEGQNAIGERIANPKVPVAGHEPVDLRTLDELAEGLERLDLLKIDTDGSDVRVLAGGAAALRRFQPLILTEVAPDHLAAQGSTPDGLLQLIEELGYRVWIFGEEDGRLRRPRGGEPLTDNIVAAPPDWQPPAVL